MQTRFFASQPVTLDIPDQPISIQHYLRQPHRLVYALADASQVDQLGQDSFRLKMRPLKFFNLSIQPTVDMKVWAKVDGTVYLQSTGCEIHGVESINHCFNLNLEGILYPVQRGSQTQLEGKANLTVQVELPPSFWFIPKSLVEKTGSGLLKSVLLTIKQRLTHQLLQDYYHWVDSKPSTPGKRLQVLPAHPPTL